MKNILYLSYDGILEPLGYSQILSYLIILSKDFNITIFSIEKENDLQNKLHFYEVKNILLNNNIKWNYLIYKKNLGRYFLVLKFFYYISKYLKNNNVKVIHARSYVCGLITYFLKYFYKFNFLFDIRGFWIDERIDWGLWNKFSLKYFFFRFYEKKIFNSSDSIVTLTNDSKSIIKKKFLKKHTNSEIYTIPTSVKIINNSKNLKNKKTLTFTHLGSIGNRYNFKLCLQLINFISSKKDIKLNILNKDEHEIINSNIYEINSQSLKYEVKYVEPYNINNEINFSNFGIFFPKKGFYLKAYFPTKFGEFMANGIPIITSRINKHLDEIIYKHRVGIIVDDFDDIHIDKIIDEIDLLINDIETTKRCLLVAKKYFDINDAANIYSKIYNK